MENEKYYKTLYLITENNRRYIKSVSGFENKTIKEKINEIITEYRKSHPFKF